MDETELIAGTVRLSGIPEGAEVYEGDNLLGTLPLSIELAPGIHWLDFRMEGYKSELRSIEVTGGEEIVIEDIHLKRTSSDMFQIALKIIAVVFVLASVHLVVRTIFVQSYKKEEKEGIVVIRGEPPGIKMYEGKKCLGTIGEGPFELRLSPGVHEITFKKAKYVSETRKVEFVAGKRKYLKEVVLKRIPPPVGKLVVLSPLTNVAVYEGGKLLDTLIDTSLSLTLSPGEHHLTFRKPHYASHRCDVTIIAGKESFLRIELIPFNGVVVLKGTPPDMEVFKGRKRLGILKDITPLPIKPGEYSFVFRKDGYFQKERLIEVKPGVKTIVEIVLTPKKGPIDRLIEQAEALLRDGRLEDAAHIFRKVLIQDPGNDTAQLGLRDVAQSYAEKARREIDQGKMESAREDIAKGEIIQKLPVFKKLRQVLRNSKGQIKIVGTPLGAKVYEGSHLCGHVPSVISLSKGYHKLCIKKQGYESKTIIVNVAGGAESPLSIKLKKIVSSKTLFRYPYLNMSFVWIPRKCFQMGDIWGDGSADERPVHQACVGGFWMGQYEVTQEQWEKVMGNNPSGFRRGGNYPVESVSWNDVQDFLRRLNSRQDVTGTFRLPTEAEWEYAARSGGSYERYAGSNDIPDKVGWYYDNSGGHPHEIGKKCANGLGLYDMSGNVAEWCADWYDNAYYDVSPQDNPCKRVRGSSESRVYRGGSWSTSSLYLRCQHRASALPYVRRNDLGFRLVCQPSR